MRRAHELVAALALVPLTMLSGCGGSSGSGGGDCPVSIAFTPAVTQGQPYSIHVGTIVKLEILQLPLFCEGGGCTCAPIQSVRWLSTNPAVAVITLSTDLVTAQLQALTPGQTTIRASVRTGGHDVEADQSQLVQVVP